MPFINEYISAKEAKFTIVITIFAAVFSNLLISLSSNIFLPLIDKEKSQDVNDHRKNIRDWEIKIGKNKDKKIEIGPFCYAFLQFFIITVILVIFVKIF